MTYDEFETLYAKYFEIHHYEDVLPYFPETTEKDSGLPAQ
jgi:hypothetical protein